LNANPISGETEPHPISPYGLAKLTAERFLDAFFHPSDVAVIHVRLCSVASNGEHPAQILSRLFDSAYKGKAIKINSGHTMNLLYIDEAVDLIINAALQAKKPKYLLASPLIAIDEIAARFEKISGKKLNAELIDLDPGVMDPVFQSDVELLHASWIRKTALDSMIEKIIARYLSAPSDSDDSETKFNFNRRVHPANHGDKVPV
jgi:nucleoside-diphosphate-sugar epimerase